MRARRRLEPRRARGAPRSRREPFRLRASSCRPRSSASWRSTVRAWPWPCRPSRSSPRSGSPPAASRKIALRAAPCTSSSSTGLGAATDASTPGDRELLRSLPPSAASVRGQAASPTSSPLVQPEHGARRPRRRRRACPSRLRAAVVPPRRPHRIQRRSDDCGKVARLERVHELGGVARGGPEPPELAPLGGLRRLL